jgi:hypothetical protein
VFDAQDEIGVGRPDDHDLVSAHVLLLAISFARDVQSAVLAD